MLQSNFIIGLCLIVGAMLGHLIIPPEVPTPEPDTEEHSEAPPSTSPPVATELAQASTPPPALPAPSPSTPPQREDAIPAHEAAPGLGEYGELSLESLQLRRPHYLENSQYQRALLIYERLAERDALTAPGELQQWATLQKKAPLWQPDLKQRQNFKIHLSLQAPADMKLKLEQLKREWEEGLFLSAGGQFTFDLKINFKQASRPELRLDSQQVFSFHSDPSKALAAALRARAGLPPAPQRPLQLALTRRQWRELP